MIKKKLFLSLLIVLLAIPAQIKCKNEINLFDPRSTEQIKEQKINDLALLGKIWGFLKYYHPQIAEGEFNWDEELINFIPQLVNYEGSSRDTLISNWINKFGSISNNNNSKEKSSNVYIEPDFSWIDSDEINIELRENLISIKSNKSIKSHFYIALAPKVGNPIFTNEESYYEMRYPSLEYRLLSLFRYWNMIHYFYPYKYLIDKDWNDVIVEYIPKFIIAQNELEYELIVLELIGEIHDTHANLWGGGDKIEKWKGSKYPPFHLRFIENRLVVTDFYNEDLGNISGLQIGDIITHINGSSVESVVEDLFKYYPGSNNASIYRDISNDLLRSNDSKVELSIIHNGKSVVKDVQLYNKDDLNIYRWYPKDEDNLCYYFVNENIGYVTLKTIRESDISQIKEKFLNTDAIIIDIRNYPSVFVPFKLGSYFVSDTTAFVKFTVSNINNPGEFYFTRELKLPKSQNPYEGKLIVLVNEHTQSQAEYTAMAFKAAENTTIIGSTTAGADGNYSRIKLPGGLITGISGIGVYYPDGTGTQRVGIVPDIFITPTIQGIRDGRDEVLDYAVELIKSK